MRDHRERVDRVAIDQHVEAHEIAAAVAEHLVVEPGIAARERLHLVEEVEDDLRERELPVDLHARGIEVAHPLVLAAPLGAERHDHADVITRDHDPRLHVRLFHVVDHPSGGHQRGVLDERHLAVGRVDLVLDARHGGDEVEVELALEPFLHDLHVQQPEESTTESEAERRGRLGLVLERGVVELELLERVAQILVLLRVGRVNAGEDERAHRLVAGECLGRLVLRVEDRVARARLFHRAHIRDHEPDLSGRELLGHDLTQLVVADFGHLVHLIRRAEGDLHALLQHAVHHAHARDRTAIAVVVRVVDERAERGVHVALRRRNLLHDLFEQLGDPEPLLGAHEQDVLRIAAEEVHHFLPPLLGLGAGQVDLVQDREDLKPRVHREEEVRERLRLDPL